MKKFIAVIMSALILAVMVVPSFAANSPTNTEGQFKVTISTTTGKGNASQVVKDDGTIVLTANPEDGESFTKWVLSGDYEIVSGSLTSGTLVIRPKSDVVVNAAFTGEGALTPDNSDKAPQTGTYTVVYALAAVAALSLVFVAKKRIADAD